MIDPPASNPPSPRAPQPHFLSAGVMVGVECGGGELIRDADLRVLEELDDTIFAALEGDAEALDHAARLWRRLRRKAPRSLVEESREQYVRRAEAICHQYHAAPGRGLGRTFAALEILALLAED